MAAASSGKSKGSSGRETSKYDGIEFSNTKSVEVPFFGLTHILYYVHRLHELAEQQRWGEQQQL